jgi:hypothetical protein
VVLKEVPILPRTHLVSQHENWFGCIYEEDKAELHDSGSVSNFYPREGEDKARQELCIFWVRDAFMG